MKPHERVSLMLPESYESGQISWRRQEFTRFLNFLVEKKKKKNEIKNKSVVRTIALFYFFFEKQNKCEAPGIFICVTICVKIKVTMMTRIGEPGGLPSMGSHRV